MPPSEFINIKLLPNDVEVSFAKDREVVLNGVSHFPEDPEKDFTGFVDTLRVANGSAIVGFRYFCFDEFEKIFVPYLRKREGAVWNKEYLDIFLTDSCSPDSVQPNGEQHIGGIFFTLDSNDVVTVSLDLSFVSEACVAELKRNVKNCFSFLQS